MEKSRLLLCRPLGGLNDILCQVERACRYGEKFGRHVVIDTDYHCTRSFQDKFSNYFTTEQEGLALDADGIGDRMDDTDVAPDFVAGRLSRYMTCYDPSLGFFVEEETRRAITFDLKRDYPQRLLVHHVEGGGALSVFALSRLRLRDNLIAALRQRLSAIGKPYTGIHIRHTDYKCEYEEWIELHKAEIEGPLFVASDNRAAIAHCKSVFGAERVYSFAALPEVAGQVLHLRSDRRGAYEHNCDAILDLLMLALSKRLHLLELLPNVNGSVLSGYSTLAANLKQSPKVLNRLLGRPEPKEVKAE